MTFAMPASAGFWDDVMGQTYIESVAELPSYNSGTPAVEWQHSGHIKGWVDIVGFRNLSKENGTFYIYGDPASLALVQYDAVGNPPGIFDSLDKSISVYESGHNTIASLHVILKWHVICCDDDGCWVCGRYTEKATFQDVEATPERFIFPGDQSVILRQYNGSVYHPQVLNFNLSPGIISYNITTSNGSIKQYLRAGCVAYTAKNIPYMNLTATEHYQQSGDISKLNDEIIINSNLTDIEFFTPYGKLNASANITKILMPETNIKNGVFGLIYIVFVFFGGLYVMGRSLFL